MILCKYNDNILIYNEFIKIKTTPFKNYFNEASSAGNKFVLIITK